MKNLQSTIYNLKSTIVWFRQDLRLEDNPALRAAAHRGNPVIPVYIWSPEEEGDWQPGAASKWWLHQSLLSLEKRLQGVGSRLIYCEGNSLETLKNLIKETGADAVFWNRRYEPNILKRDFEIKEELLKDGLIVETFNSSLLFDPWEIKTKQGKPYKVFTAFWNACLASPRFPLPQPSDVPAFLENDEKNSSLHLADFKLEPKIHWTKKLHESWKPGHTRAMSYLQIFLEERLLVYPKNRDIPGIHGTSRLSPYLHYGIISPREICYLVKEQESRKEKGIMRAGESFVRELIWREFAYHLLYHFPETTDQPLKKEFEKFPWRHDIKSLKAWQQGETGYPIVDAGMRELWQTGWMHNRARMIVASFLVKDLLLPWQLGASWFWDTLVDADLACNTLNWQWVAGCGADAAPFFRIFNPVTQGEKFDPLGVYVSKWLPELKNLSDDYIHKPWTAPKSVLSSAGIKLGKTYPKPIVDHVFARDRALAAFKKMKKK